ncbi:type I DNA topoisomerase [Humibacter ginsengiterrae]
MPGNKLVIVESPTKVKSIEKYLGDGYTVEASVGHIRDLIEPKDIPAEKKRGAFGQFGVDVDNGFEPYYVVSDRARSVVAKLRKLLKNADELLLATDEDREGEAIAWHLLEELKPKVPVKRMVFHEITKDAIEKAKDNTRDLDMSLVDAQETRRILDRLYGYEVSPVLWRKVRQGLSAGRVQSPATRLVVDRERERMAFVAASYWDLIAQVAADAGAQSFSARLSRVDGQRVAAGRDFDDRGQLKNEARVFDESSARALADALRQQSTAVTVAKLETRPLTRKPSAPFTTSTLQQEAARKLRFTARQTMSVAQSLYENGHITYMRTDSTALSAQAVGAARAQAKALYGADSIPSAPRTFPNRSKNAQEAHEAIRPAGDTWRTPAEMASVLHGNELRLFELIWKRTVASQMADAKGQTASVTIEARVREGALDGTIAELTASGTVITFRGFLQAYEESRDEERNAEATSEEAKLPPLTEGQTLVVGDVEAKGHETSPPPRYTEASLVKRMEELGVGRPSTYATILSTIVDRGYVSTQGQALVPNWIAFAVVRLLEDHFGDLVEYDFTAELENNLDRIADGDETRAGWLKGFYFGSGDHRGLREVVDNLGEIDAREINSVRITDDITLRIGRYGPYLEVTEQGAGPDATPRRVNIPPDLAPDELTVTKAKELIEAPVQSDRELGVNPANGKLVVVKDGRFGPYVTELEADEAPVPDSVDITDAVDAVVDLETGEVSAPKKKKKKASKAKAAKAEKPRTASLFKSMDPAGVDLQTALKLLDLPRTVGEDPESGEPILAQNGRYGAYLKKGADTRSLPSEDAIFDIDLPGALELFAQPKYGARRASSALKEFDADPVSGKSVRVKDGRFGPYVTDGETNATIPRGESVEEIDFQRAVQLLADKRAKGPAKRAGTTRRTTKAAGAKAATKTAGKSTAKKAPAKPAVKKTGTPKSSTPKKPGADS